MTDKQFLAWIHERLLHVHKEHADSDYMNRLRSIITATPMGQVTHNRYVGNTLPEEVLDGTEVSMERGQTGDAVEQGQERSYWTRWWRR